MTFLEKLILNDGQTIVHKDHKFKGSLQETDIDTYDVVDQEGVKVGDLVVIDHTAVKGFTRTVSVKQRDAKGNVLVETSWNPPR